MMDAMIQKGKAVLFFLSAWTFLGILAPAEAAWTITLWPNPTTMNEDQVGVSINLPAWGLVGAAPNDGWATIVVTQGTVTVVPVAPVLVANNGTNNVTINTNGGLQENVRDTLRTMTYTPTADYFGADTLTVTFEFGASKVVDLTINPVNDVPSFTKGSDQNVQNYAGAQTVVGWATAISPGPANEAPQIVDFIVSNDNNAIFSVQPAVTANGDLTFTPALSQNGTAIVSVQIHDDGGIANGGVDTSAVQTFIITVTGLNVGPGSVYQLIATTTFTSPAPDNRFLLSSWVCPGTGTAAIGFFLGKEDGSQAGFIGIELASTGQTVSFGSPVGAGIVETTNVSDGTGGNLVWYRIYVTFDYSYDPNVASSTSIVLQNQSPPPGKNSVWFDGVQLEKAHFAGQKHPTTYSRVKKLVSPNRGIDLKGKSYYYEW